MIWGCMTFYGCRLFMKIDGKVNHALYKEILEVGLSSTFCFHDIDPRLVLFQQDNAPIHNAKSMKQWFKQQSFDLLQWPTQSPYLNPIERMWTLVKRGLNQYENTPSNLLELWDCVQEIWCANFS